MAFNMMVGVPFDLQHCCSIGRALMDPFWELGSCARPLVWLLNEYLCGGAATADHIAQRWHGLKPGQGAADQ